MRPWIILNIVAAGLVVVLVVAWYKLTPIGEGQPWSNTPSPVLGPESTLGQTFRAPYNHLFRIDVKLATYRKQPHGRLILHLRSSSDASRDLATVEIDAAEVSDNQFQPFIFQPIAESAGRDFYFLIETPDGSLENPISIWLDGQNPYLDGTGYRNGQMMEGDLAFQAYYQMSPSEALGVVLGRFAERKPALLASIGFFRCLIIANLVGVLGFLTVLTLRGTR